MGRHEHFKGNPDDPIAWGVSTCNKFYNFVLLYNGIHAEHRFRPKVHWTKRSRYAIRSAPIRTRTVCT